MSRTAFLTAVLAMVALVGAADGVWAQLRPDCPNPKAIGVSRVVEIDTAGGPRFGVQFNRSSLLVDGEVVLTFDDGPLRPYTQQVLDALAAHCTKATFFMVGRRAMADPEMAQAVARQGHTIGTHTWSHRNMTTITPAHARAEIDLGFSAVRWAVGAPIAPLFRFPYLAYDEAMLSHIAARNIAAFSIDIDPFDYLTRDAARVVRDTLRKALSARKGIILFHDIEPSTAGAVKTVLDQLQSRGIRVVHMVAKGTAQTLPVYDAFVAKPLSEATRPFLTSRATYWPLNKDGDLVVPVPVAGKARSKPKL